MARMIKSKQHDRNLSRRIGAVRLRAGQLGAGQPSRFAEIVRMRCRRRFQARPVTSAVMHCVFTHGRTDDYLMET
jgi:hypothetical protein